MFDSVDFTETEGVKILLGDPFKTIIKLSIPIIIGMSLLTLYNIVDAFWVSGLGAGTAISRRIGVKNEK